MSPREQVTRRDRETATPRGRWTREIRCQVYRWLREESGRRDPQQLTLFDSPQDRARAIRKIVEKLTGQYGQGYTVTNVDMQVKWALTMEKRVKRPYIRQYFFAKAAALEAGLISERNFPPSVEFWQ